MLKRYLAVETMKENVASLASGDGQSANGQSIMRGTNDAGALRSGFSPTPRALKTENATYFGRNGRRNWNKLILLSYFAAHVSKSPVGVKISCENCLIPAPEAEGETISGKFYLITGDGGRSGSAVGIGLEVGGFQVGGFQDGDVHRSRRFPDRT